MSASSFTRLMPLLSESAHILSAKWPRIAHRQQVGVRTRARTVRHVRLCGAFGLWLAVWLDHLRLSPLLAPVGAGLPPGALNPG